MSKTGNEDKAERGEDGKGGRRAWRGANILILQHVPEDNAQIQQLREVCLNSLKIVEHPHRLCEVILEIVTCESASRHSVEAFQNFTATA